MVFVTFVRTEITLKACASEVFVSFQKTSLSLQPMVLFSTFEQPSQLVCEIPDARNRKLFFSETDQESRWSEWWLWWSEMVFGRSTVCNVCVFFAVFLHLCFFGRSTVCNICVTNTSVTACPPTRRPKSNLSNTKVWRLFLISQLCILRIQLLCSDCTVGVKWKMFNWGFLFVDS